MLQSQKRCRMVSLVSPQKAHNSVSTSLHLYNNVCVGMVLSVTGSNMEQYDKIRNCIKPCKTFYNIFLKKYTERPINSQNKWENEWSP
jgi:hypothetical protein